jgi:hypothetical protein
MGSLAVAIFGPESYPGNKVMAALKIFTIVFPGHMGDGRVLS